MTGRGFSEHDVHLALDGELPADERAAYEAWLDANPDVKARAGRYADDSALLRDVLAPVADEPVPERLTRVVAEDRSGPSGRPTWWRVAAAAAIFAFGGATGYFAGAGGWPGGAEREQSSLADRAIDAYVTFPVDRGRTVEVSAEDRPQLEGWLSRRTGLKLIAPDLTAEGFELLGGRILPAEGHTAALLVYKDAGDNQVSIYLTAEGAEKTRGVYAPAEGGPVAIYWLDKGFACAIVTALPKPRLDEVVSSAWRQIKEGLAG